MAASHKRQRRALRDAFPRKLNLDLTAEIESLKAAVEALQRTFAEREADRRSVLLGQLAYTVDAIATSYVFGAGSRPINLSYIQDAAEDDAAVAERWQQVATFAEQQGVSITRLIQRSSALRSRFLSVAHGSPDELDSTTPDQLREWGTASYASATETLLRFLEPLTLDGKPLRPRQDVATIFAAVL
ncbi:hypothetical protein CHLRE_06g294776v5 [Chlamydomonas reinhardtii]|uniref:Uncharacterized protein n=1 Tax=Chlamydomonas reinhardtii TaxID=3055 RepID=A8JFJ0_CHLRE|nr:uncharacterized protein CHLRE_06g294776v5 [Chlamydomonas reinhardtii]PNW82800.1 hypothetical protein CHLRE_06g294776v5 [Chlamydomonas reinhardtii]|eukprot:XP_001701587.1 predicted protein [Chlamydomonas reinhardtii]